jgi:glycosyl hydrolase family 2
VTLTLPLQSSDQTPRIELERDWELLVDPSGRLTRDEALNAAGWRAARAGLSWNVQFEDLRDYMGAAWYRTKFELSSFLGTRHVLLKFGAVDYFCEVFVNGYSVGTHEGGYTPFSFEITSASRPGVNELMVRVIDPPTDEVQNRALFPDMMYNEIPHGKQNWYVQNSGIWQGVRVELCPSLYIERLDVTPGVDGQFSIDARLAGVGLIANDGADAKETRIQAAVYDSAGRPVYQHEQKLETFPNVHLTGTIPNAKFWSPDNPALYAVEVSLEGAVHYGRRTRFGFRTFEAKDGELLLNGEPFFMFAALDQDFYPETVHTPTSVEFIRDMMMKAKKLGFNVLRCHLKVAHPVYLDVADELGMLIWTELPSWSDSWFPSDHFSIMASVRAEKMFWEILIRDWNHPCIVIQTLINESWGLNLKDAEQRAWLRKNFERVKGLLAPLGRLVIDNSPCEGNFHIKTDIDDFHQYYSMPDQADLWDEWLDELAARPSWSFSPYGDAERSCKEPLMVSEFGNWGLPKLPDELPWWFHVTFGDREVTRPSGVFDRFRDFRFASLFGTYNELAVETQWHQFSSLKYEIESIRAKESLRGYVITGITDVHWEVNGVLDMWRNEKVYAEDLANLQHPDLVMCRLPGQCFYGGAHVQIPVLLSHYSDRDLNGASIRWSTSSGARGTLRLPQGVRAGTVLDVGQIQLELPSVETPTTERLEIELRTVNGHRWIENSYDMCLLPKLEEQDLPLSPTPAGFQNRDQGSAIVATKYDETLAAHLESGGDAVLLVNSLDAIPSGWTVQPALRVGTELEGRWFSNYNWIRTQQRPFSDVAFRRILDFESREVAPRYILRGIAAEDFDEVLSGITYGWLNNNSALVLQTKVGPGRLLITTYRFGKYGKDPYATHLLNALLRYVSSFDCRPRLQLPNLVAGTA